MASANTRPSVSAVPPGAKGTTNLIGRDGQSCAWPARGAAKAKRRASPPTRIRLIRVSRSVVGASNYASTSLGFSLTLLLSCYCGENLAKVMLRVEHESHAPTEDCNRYRRRGRHRP